MPRRFCLPLTFFALALLACGNEETQDNTEPLTIETDGTLPSAMVVHPYSVTLTASGGVPPYTWTDIVSDPPGYPLAPISPEGVMAGTPPTGSEGAYAVTVSVTDAVGHTRQKELSLVIAPLPPIVIPTTALPAATITVPYSATVTVTGGLPPFNWEGTLIPPQPLTLSQSGVLAGVPNYPAGRHLLRVVISDGWTYTVKVLPLTIEAQSGLVITAPDTLPPGRQFEPYSTTLTAAGGAPPYTWTRAPWRPTLASGMEVSSAGVFAGTPEGSTALGGNDSLVFMVTDVVGATAFKAVHFPVALAPVRITVESLPAGREGTSYLVELTETGSVDGGPGRRPHWDVSAGSLPPGLGFRDRSLCCPALLSGIPTTRGSYAFTLRVTDDAGRSDTKPFVVAISPPEVVITTSALPEGHVAVPYNVFLVASGGVPPYAWSTVGTSLPAGLTLTTNGQLGGTPQFSGTTSLMFVVSDSLQQADTATIALTILP